MRVRSKMLAYVHEGVWGGAETFNTRMHACSAHMRRCLLAVPSAPFSH